MIQTIEKDPFQKIFLRFYELSAQLAASKMCLDVCCGYGWGTLLLSRSARLVVGVDKDIDRVRYANNTFASPNLQFCISDASSLSFGRMFDVITLINGYQYVPNILPMFKSMTTCLIDKGLIFLITRPSAKFSRFTIAEMNHLLLADFEEANLTSVYSSFVTNKVEYFGNNVQEIVHILHILIKK